MKISVVTKIMFLTILTKTTASFLDMTHQLHNNVPSHPLIHPFTLALLLNETQPEGYWLQMEELCTSVHIGTHIDAPCHFGPGKWCIHEIPFDHFIGPAIVVDITEKVAEDPDTALSVDDLVNWENNNGRIPDGSILVVRSGWGKLWQDKEKFLGTDMVTDHTKLHSPGISAEAARWLVEYTNIYAVGVETLSLDCGKSLLYEVHTILLNANIYGIENMANVDKLPVTGATIFAMPMNIRDGSGAPARVFAKMQD